MIPCEICQKEVDFEEYAEHYVLCETKPVEPKTDFPEMFLNNYQKNALKYAQEKAKKLSDLAYDSVLARIKHKGYDEVVLFLINDYLLNTAPILIHFNCDTVLDFFCNDIYYRNQFQTSASNGALSYGCRLDWEKNMFGETYNDCDGFYRVKYGCLNFLNANTGVGAAYGYGNSYLVLKNSIKERTTITFGDSACSGAAKNIGTFDNCNHIIDRLDDTLLNELIEIVIGNKDSSLAPYGFYVECQYHGDVHFARDVEKVVINSTFKNNSNVNKLLDKFQNRHGLNIVYMA